jgi:hypothetical protein
MTRLAPPLALVLAAVLATVFRFPLDWLAEVR